MDWLRKLTRRRETDAAVEAEVARAVAERARALQRVTDAALAHLRLDDLLDELLERVSEELVADTAAVLLVDREDELLASRGEGPSAVTIEVPLLAGERVLGVIQVGWIRGRRPTPGEIDLLTLAADRAALAIERARLYERERATADMLQNSLLPERLPDIPGIELAARYRAAGERFQVGGDFYDAFQISAEHWLVVVGDVCGKGPEAATLTALARYTLRAEAMHEPRPAELLGLLNDAIIRQRSDGRFCTAVCALLELRDGSVEVTLASGGHPLPMVLRADGSVQEAGLTGTLLGIVADVEHEDVRVPLEPGDTLVLYTDGLTEARAPEAITEPDELAAMVAACAGQDPGELVRALEGEALGDAREEPRDDLAVLALRVTDPRRPARVAAPDATPVHPELEEAALPGVPARSLVEAPAPAATPAPALALWVPATDDAPTIARHAVVRNARLHGRTREMVELLVTELVANAVQHAGLSPHDLVSIRLEHAPGQIRCEVLDPGAAGGMLAAAAPQPSAEHTPDGGMGLFLVDRLSDRWGAEQSSDGTRAWFELAT